MGAGLKVGVNQALVYNSGSDGSPTWVEITAAKDVALPLDMGMAEIKARLSIFVQHLPAMMQAPLEFGMIADTSLAPYNVLRNAQINQTLVDLAVTDDATIATSGADYFRAHYYIGGFKVDQKLEEGQEVQVTAALAYSTRVPAWTDVA